MAATGCVPGPVSSFGKQQFRESQAGGWVGTPGSRMVLPWLPSVALFPEPCPQPTTLRAGAGVGRPLAPPLWAHRVLSVAATEIRLKPGKPGGGARGPHDPHQREWPG